jgi:hypothetical protein
MAQQLETVTQGAVLYAIKPLPPGGGGGYRFLDSPSSVPTPPQSYTIYLKEKNTLDDGRLRSSILSLKMDLLRR